MFTSKVQLYQRFWLSVKQQKFKAKKLRGGGGQIEGREGGRVKLTHHLMPSRVNKRL